MVVGGDQHDHAGQSDGEQRGDDARDDDEHLMNEILHSGTSLNGTDAGEGSEARANDPRAARAVFGPQTRRARVRAGRVRGIFRGRRGLARARDFSRADTALAGAPVWN